MIMTGMMNTIKVITVISKINIVSFTGAH